MSIIGLPLDHSTHAQDTRLQGDDDLLERVQANQPDALAHLYDRFAPGIYAYIYRQIGDKQLAEDLTGDVFVQALGALRKNRFARATLVGWLYRMAHNRVIDHYRRERKKFVPLEEWLPDAMDVVETTTRKLEQDWLQRALHFLTPEQQQVITLRFGEEMSAPDVARVMGKDENAVRALQHRALAALRRLMDKGHG